MPIGKTTYTDVTVSAGIGNTPWFWRVMGVAVTRPGLGTRSAAVTLVPGSEISPTDLGLGRWRIGVT